jgi:undecaprenyl pyrophosphate phosphatase UppP
MLLIIFLAIMTTLAIAQGMLLLFLIRSRGHMLALSTELLKLQQDRSKITAISSQIAAINSDIEILSKRCNSIEKTITNPVAATEYQKINNKVIRLAAVGS